MSLTTVEQSNSATVAVVAGDYVVLKNAPTERASLEVVGGAVIEAYHNGRQIYGPFTAGNIKISAIVGGVQYEVGSDPALLDDQTPVSTASDGGTTEETVATTTYSLTADDFTGKTKVFTNAAGCLVTIPAGLGVDTGKVVQWRQASGAGQITFQASGAGCTVFSVDNSLTSGGENSVGSLVHTGADDYLLAGQIGTPRIIQNSQSAAYQLVLSDAGKHLLHPSADTTPRTFTIPANSAVAFPVGTVVTFINQNSAGTLTIAITTDTMRLAGAGTTGSRTLAANGIATAVKVTSTEWIISGTGLT